MTAKKPPITKPFEDTVRERARSDPAFRDELLAGGYELQRDDGTATAPRTKPARTEK